MLSYLTPEEIGAENVKKRARGVPEDQITNQQVGSVADGFLQKFELGTSDADTCPVDEAGVLFGVFALGPDAAANKFYPKARIDWITEIVGPMKKEYLVRITSRPTGCEETGSIECADALEAGNWSNTVQNDVTVCGNERL